MAAEIVGSDGKGKDGLVGYLVNVAKKEPRSYCALLARVLPLHVKASVDPNPVTRSILDELDRTSHDGRTQLH